MYQEIPASQVPEGITWHAPDNHLNQTLVTEYSKGSPPGNDGHDGAWYKRITDNRDGSVEFYIADQGYIPVGTKVKYCNRAARNARPFDPAGVVTKYKHPHGVQCHPSYEVDWQDSRGPQWGYRADMLLPEYEW